MRLRLAFLQGVSVDHWQKGRVLTVQAPTIAEDTTKVIAAHMVSFLCRSAGMMWFKRRAFVMVMMQSTDWTFSMKNSVVRRDFENDVAGTEVFLCVVTDTRAESMYQVRKIAAILGRHDLLHGFMIALVGKAPSNLDQDLHFKVAHANSDSDLPAVEVCVLSYERKEFDQFETRAREATCVEDWEKETLNFMRMTYLSPSIATCPRYRTFPLALVFHCSILQLHIPSSLTAANLGRTAANSRRYSGAHGYDQRRSILPAHGSSGPGGSPAGDAYSRPSSGMGEAIVDESLSHYI
ncbi:uncharacterized protein B0H18DRAFT_955417 [Fomitopsis serialis]|uniref:uncharacterized protein n=1 Tax=Fomitopsis serialis TaxID=139415 RepID=UPI0020072D59|nr:uncharacterized protein B0H18DRAFT_955417 [Neoantrodia serialis]KAH9924502.1 hypothetical protein B0H18DRAFT_955417 [Neoantrodia serialis]